MFNVARIFGFYNREGTINRTLEDSPEIVYGARAMNIHLPINLRRHTRDYDIYSRTPKAKAIKLEKALDRDSGGNFFYVKQALHKGTWKVMDIGLDNRRGTYDDFGVADYSKPDRKIRFNIINNIRYASLSERAKDARKSLRNPRFQFRHSKDRFDLWRINQAINSFKA